MSRSKVQYTFDQNILVKSEISSYERWEEMLFNSIFTMRD